MQLLGRESCQQDDDSSKAGPEPVHRGVHLVAQPVGIVIGQYLGFFVILLVSTLGFFSKLLLPLAWIGFLGVVPIILGLRRVRELLRKRTQKQEETGDAGTYVQASMPQSFTRLVFTPFLNFQTYRVTLLTLGNGSDNISTYTPLFASESFILMMVLIGLFLLLVGVWCFIGYTVARLPPVAYIIAQYGRILLPFAYILLGFYIMAQCGTFRLLFQLISLR